MLTLFFNELDFDMPSNSFYSGNTSATRYTPCSGLTSSTAGTNYANSKNGLFDMTVSRLYSGEHNDLCCFLNFLL